MACGGLRHCEVRVFASLEDMVKKHETDMEKHAARMKKVREGK